MKQEEEEEALERRKGERQSEEVRQKNDRGAEHTLEILFTKRKKSLDNPS